MPAALLLARPSGLYCRLLVPLSLRAVLGKRYIVRSLRTCDRDKARLVAALIALEARAVFAALARGDELGMDDIKKILEDLNPDKVRKYEVDLRTGKVKADSAEDHARAMEAVEKIGLLPAHIFNPAVPGPTFIPAPAPPRPVAYEKLLSARQAEHDLHATVSKKATKTIDEFERALRLLVECCGDKPPADYTVTDADFFGQTLMALPVHNAAFRDPDIPPVLDKNNHKQYAMLPAPKMVELNKTLQLPKIEVRTINKQMERVRAFFNWCKKRHYMGAENVFADRGHSSTSSNTSVTRVPFSEEDVARIFAPTTFLVACNEPHKFWGPLLGLFTGARRNEIGQLYVADILQDAGLWGIGIDAIYKNQSVKNVYSKRSIPLHSKLVELGFLDYVNDVKKHGFDRVFPMLTFSKENGYGDALADAFHRYLRSKASPKPGAKPGTKKAAPRVGIDDPGKVFHSFRYRFCNRLYQDNEAPKVKELSGHEREGVFNTVYAGRLDFGKKITIIESLPHVRLALPRYQPGQLDAYFEKLKRTQKQAAANAEARARRDAGETLE